jgi:hypothetical protein
LLPIFGFPIKNTKKYKKYISKNLFGRNQKIGVRKGCWNSHKMARNWLGGSEIQELKFDIIRALLTKKIQVEKKSLKSDVYGLN